MRTVIGSIPPEQVPHGRRGVLAAIDLGTEQERHADLVLEDLAAAMEDVGGSEVTGATHWSGQDGPRHVALTLEVTGLGEDAFAAVLDRSLATPRQVDPIVRSTERSGSGRPDLTDGLTAALGAHATRTSGRVAVFPGAARAAAAPSLPVDELLALTPIDRVVQLAAGDADGHAVVASRGHLRPRWQAGELVLHVQPAAGGLLVPFEVPDPTPCCAAHA